jgi:CheY-like chemotaxis protein
MHEVDGLTATRRIRADERLRDLPIIAMTAHAMAGDRERSVAAGMNDHVVKPIDPDLLFRTLLKWIDPARLAGRRTAAEGPVIQPAQPAANPAAAPGLPAIIGVDWDRALAGVNRDGSRLQRRVRSFHREYEGAPRLVRQAGADDDPGALQGLAHNLKSSAAYIGAFELATLAGALEQDLRSGRTDRLAERAAPLLAALETVLDGLAQLDTPAAGLPRYGVTDVIRQLDAYLREDDARAEDALLELQAMLAAAPHRAALDAIASAVHDLEYEAARAPLAGLASALGTTVEETA